MKTIEMGRICRTHGTIQKCKVLVERPDGKRPIGSPRCRYENKFKMNLKAVILGTTLTLFMI